MDIIIATLIVVVVIASALAQDFAIFSWDYWQEGGNALRSEIVRNLGLLTAGVIGVAFGIWRAVTAYHQTKASQARIAEQGLITDRYAKAVEMLSSDKARARTGAVYALARIAQDSIERDHIPIMAVLCEFVVNPPYTAAALNRTKARNAAQEAGEQEGDSDGAPETPPTIQCPDVVAALSSIARRNTAQKSYEKKVDTRVNFVRANLRELNLERAKLTGAFLMMADLTGARLNFADLTGASLTFARLTNATFSFANLTGAMLRFVATFKDADFVNADLTGADFMDADLTGVDLSTANLTSANLRDANLRDANLRGANLTDANLTRVMNLDQNQLDSACIIEGGNPPSLPEGLNPPQRFCP